MENFVCSECHGRRFQKISSTEYECEYCGAIIKTTAPASPKVVVVQQTMPKPIATPFPAELSYLATLREGFNSLSGKIYIYPDKFAFCPSSSILNGGNLSPREWRIVDITGYTKGILALLDIKVKDGSKIRLSVNNKKVIINALEERRKFWLQRQG